MQARDQYGDLRIRKHNKGPDVWPFRYFQNRKRESVLVGTVEKLPTQAVEQRAVEHRRIEINALSPQQQFHSVTVGGLIDQCIKDYAPKPCRKLTQSTYRSLFKNNIRPASGGMYLQHVETLAVEPWLEGYNSNEVEGEDGKKVEKPVSRQIKAHVRNLMHTLFQAAMRYETVERNHIDLVRQSRKRLKRPRVLTPAQFIVLVGKLGERYKCSSLWLAWVRASVNSSACGGVILILRTSRSRFSGAFAMER